MNTQQQLIGKEAYKNNLKWLCVLVLVQIFVVPIVISIFKFVPDRKIAAVVAGMLFIAADFFIFIRLRLMSDFYALLSYWFVLTHLFIFAIPMFLARIAFWEKDFEDIKFLIFTGVEFHQLANKASLIFFCGTLFDILVTFIKYRRSKSS